MILDRNQSVFTSPDKAFFCNVIVNNDTCVVHIVYLDQVTIRHFSANNYVNDKDPSAVWNGVRQRSRHKLRQIHL